MSAPQLAAATRIAELNDAFRQGGPAGRHWHMTRAVQALGGPFLAIAVAEVESFDAFDASNNPYGERDFGAFDLGGERLFWKIDYYDLDLKQGSEDPADPSITRRVMTIMLASDY